MESRALNLKPQRTTLRSRRPLILRLLLTAFCTAAVLTAGIYGLKKRLEAVPARVAQAAAKARAEPQPEDSGALPGPEPAVLYAAAAAPGAAPDSVAMVKTGRAPAGDQSESAGSAARASRPRLRPVGFGSSGGKFATPMYEEPAAARARRPEDGILLKPSDLTKKIKVKGAGPVSPAKAKRYSGIDPEAEALRARVRAKAAAAEAARKRLLLKKLELSGLIALLGLAVILAGSRVIRALRLLKRSEGAHWTLK